MMNLYVLILVVLALQHITVGDLSCGQINNRKHYKDNEKPRHEDYGWLGRVYGSKVGDFDFGSNRFLCNANLITERHLITSTFYCARFFITPDFLLFGNGTPDVSDPELKYTIKDIAIHPSFDDAQITNDIAIIHLVNDVKFNDFVRQPICLPPASSYTRDFADEYLQLVEHLRNRTEPEISRSIAHIIPIEECTILFNYKKLNNKLCTAVVGGDDFISGSALMGFNVENPKDKSLYLIGTLGYSTTPTTKEPEPFYVFTRIASHINWINTNIRHSF